MKFLTLILFCVILTGCNRQISYDCGMAEWHPDIPNKVKEECRKQYKKHEENFLRKDWT